MIIKTIKVSGKGQIALPKDVRKEAKIKEGDTLILVEDNGKLLLEKSQRVSAEVKDKFKDLIKHSEKLAKKLWSNKADEIWDTV